MIGQLSRPPRLPPLKLLQKALELKGSQGLCFHRSAAFVFDVPGSTMMFGTFEAPPPDQRLPGDSDVPFIHAWAEWRGFVYAPTTIERLGGLCPINLVGYYAVNGIHDVRTLTRPQLLALDRQLALKRALRLNLPCRGGASFGGSLLDAAGVRWQPATGGGVIPA